MLSSTEAEAGRSRTSGLTLVRRKWSGHDVPSSPRRGCSACAEELEDDVGVGEVADHRAVRRGDAADGRREGGGLGAALGLRQGGVPLERRTERLGLGVLGDVGGGGVDDPEAVGLGLLAGVAPRGDAVAAEDAAAGLRVLLLDLGDVEAELEAGAAPRHPHDLVAEDGPGQLLAVGRGRDRDAGVGVQVVDVRRVDEAVHRGVDRRCGTALAVQAVVEGRDHLVLAVHAGVDVDERAHPVQPQHGQAARRQRAEVTAGTLHPQQLDVLAGDRVGLGALGGGVAAGVVGVPGVGAQPVGALDELLHSGVDGGVEVTHGAGFLTGCGGQFQPACEPPTRSASICCW